MNRLPSFIVIGSGKSGTSSLHEYLRQHPNISLPLRKETHFFVCDKNSQNHLTEYEGRTLDNPIDNIEDYLNEFEKKKDIRIFGEVCPSYIFFPPAAENIYNYIPQVKIICILRNPVDRLYSNFNFNMGDNLFEEFLQNVDILPNYSDVDFKRWVKEGLYFPLLERYYNKFPKEQIKIFLFDDLVKSPNTLMAEFMEFIGLPPFSFNTDLKFNTSGKIPFPKLRKYLKDHHIASKLRSHLPVSTYQEIRNLSERLLFIRAKTLPQKTRAKILAFYRNDIIKTQELINRDLTKWLAN